MVKEEAFEINIVQNNMKMFTTTQNKVMRLATLEVHDLRGVTD